jgi:methyltransferase (TIGR00027 family)
MAQQASLTAVTAARGRAAHLLLDGEPKIFRDDFALQFSGADSEASFRQNINAMLAEVAAKAGPDAAQQSFRVARASMLMRSRYTEDALSLAIARGITHYVILGAGLDSFAWRRTDLATAIQVFEIDHPASQQWKQQRLRELGIGRPPNLTFLPIDFERETLVNGLREGGYPLDKPAFVSWLGVTQYLTREAVLSTLKEVAALARGTEISFTFIVPQALWVGDGQRMFPIAVASTAASGEPWISFFDPAELASQLKQLGFNRVVHFSPDDANDLYFSGRTDGLRIVAGEHVMRAQVE